MKKILFTVIIFATTFSVYGQIRDYELGALAADGARRSIYGGFFDYSDPEAVNIKLSVWGYVKFPGRYIVPDYSTLIDLMSYSGGPVDDANLDQLRIYRINDENEEIMLSVDLNDLMWEDELEEKYRSVPSLQPSDIVVIPGEPRLYFTDWFGIGLSVFSALISLAILILTINNS